ncbi:biotin--[acetyl-CoA-carboxylase] ligase [Bordetella petrii]|uniref:biotin--[biotin carboxyl-carrier protein] ligase n=1 Tax=Bordetella petrii (strain ATCC BAA-461 / DSM 12804 / CCUG 43448 / CIP 107267 / Se-1111R) TaxID=340100 RepID=A9IH77_BORPD|nr:biotin--[acetyl-CoA-carboxylase] ligase [Bordetella petrii]CAP45161.1 putative biotin protein ligase [Bordetella petrii]
MLTDVRHTDLPAPDALARELSARLDGFQSIGWTASTGSTNADLLARARASGGSWLLGTHLQQAGRGRAGRPWQNRSGAALMFSCAFPVRMPANRLPALSPLAGLAACEALRSLAGGAAGLGVKWPNDVQWHDAKLAGVLVESARDPAVPGGYIVVIGMGVNLRDADTLSRALDRAVADWTCVVEQAGCAPVSAADIVCAAATAWRDAVRDLEAHGFAPFRARFHAVDALAGRAVNVVDQGAVLFSGTANGLDEQGRLLVQTGGGLTPVSVGEISIRPAAGLPESRA